MYFTLHYTKYIPQTTFERSIQTMKYFPDILRYSQGKDEPYETEDCIRYEFKLLDLHDFANPDAPHAHESFLNSCFRCMQRYILCTKAHAPADLHPVAKPETPKANNPADINTEDMKKLRDKVQDMSKLPFNTRIRGLGTTTTDMTIASGEVLPKGTQRQEKGPPAIRNDRGSKMVYDWHHGADASIERDDAPARRSLWLQVWRGGVGQNSGETANEKV